MPWKRRPFKGRELSRALNIADLREIARRRVPGFAFEYLEGGAEDEHALHGNREALDRLRLIPQTLTDTCGRSSRTELFGRPVLAPLIIAPTGLNGMLHPQGDLALARAATRAGIPYTLSTFSTTRLEQIAEDVRKLPGPAPQLWMQLYVMKYRRIAEDMMQRATAAGYEALVFTTDANVFGSREWDKRSYRTPGRLTGRNLLDTLKHPGWLLTVIGAGIPHFRNIEAHLPPEARSAVGASTVIPTLFEPTITWSDIAWIRDHWKGKLLIKGVLNVADAERASSLGCDGIVLTNHGGRQLDSCVSSVEVLPQVASAVGTRLTILVDGGFRRGTHVAKALALGADAVMIGRPTLYGLAAGGEEGVERALAILMSEFDRVLGQLGCRSVAELDSRFIFSA